MENIWEKLFQLLVILALETIKPVRGKPFIFETTMILKALKNLSFLISHDHRRSQKFQCFCTKKQVIFGSGLVLALFKPNNLCL